MILAVNSTVIAIIVVIAVIAIVTLIIVGDELDKEKDRRVKEVSPYYLAILELNKKIYFRNVDQTYSHRYVRLNSKRQFDNYNYIKGCEEYIKDNLSVYSSIIDSIEYNKTACLEYEKLFKEIRHTSNEQLAKDNKMSLNSMIERETRLANDLHLRPATYFSITVEASYTSPQGRNSYQNGQIFDSDFIKQCILKYQNLSVEKEKPDNNITVRTNKVKSSTYLPTKSPKTSKNIDSIDDLEEVK